MFIMKHRRRREKKTNSRKRLALLLSNKPRLVVRRKLNNISVQLVSYKPEGDITLASAVSQELKKVGWRFSTGNTPAAYLTGYLAGSRAKSKNDSAVLDTGLHTLTKGSRIYAALKGAVDAGLKIPHSVQIFPKEERIKGTHISKELESNFQEVLQKLRGSHNG